VPRSIRPEPPWMTSRQGTDDAVSGEAMTGL
jgi:hypothetical protein